MKSSGYQKIKTDGNEEKISLFSRLSFQWMNNVFKTGRQGTIQESDFPSLSRETSTESFTERLQTNWNREKAKWRRDGQRPKLWKSVLKMISFTDAMLILVTELIYIAWRLLKPLFLGYLISSLMEVGLHPRNNLLLYGCLMAMAICGLTSVIARNHFGFACDVLGIGMSTALKGLIYQKVLLLNRVDLFQYTTGRVIDLVSNDVQRLEGITVQLALLSIADFSIVMPIVTISILYFIGWQGLMGVLCLCLLLPYFAGLAYISAAYHRRTAAVSDRRISLLNQVISGIRAIKTYAWEDKYGENIKRIRRDEITLIRKKSAVLSSVASLEYTSVPLAMMVSVITLVLTGQPLTPVRVFMLLCFINVARMSACFYVPYGFLDAYEAYVSLKRIEDFLLLKGLPRIEHKNPLDSITDASQKGKSNLKRAAPYKQDNRDSRRDQLIGPDSLSVCILKSKENKRDGGFILRDIEFSTFSQGLAVITGSVGSGKSSLLLAIAGEESVTVGTITRPHSLVYVPQTPWVFSGTVRQNILFGEPYNETIYSKVVDACALMEDFQTFPNGDQTVVGERGVILSGGQCARVSLARAVYKDADLYLLDDPLSAVDAKVGQQIFEKCIMGTLRNKSRVLASHQERHMKEADEVIVMHKGSVLDKGTFAGLLAKGTLSNSLDLNHLKPIKDSKSVGRCSVQSDDKPLLKDAMIPVQNHIKDLQISDEDRVIGAVTFKTYWDYLRSGLHPIAILGVISLCVVAQAMIVFTDVWVALLTKKSKEDQRDRTNLIIYGCLVLGTFLLAKLRAFGFLWASLRCSECLHDKMVTAILKAPVLFFDSNPVGRILNRFSKDISCLDDLLPKCFLFSIQLTLLMLASVLVATATNPWLLFIAIPVAVIIVFICKYYLKTCRQLKRLESINRSPVYSHISETLNGLETIRTRERQRNFVEQFYRYQDVHLQSYITVLAGERWLGVHLSVLVLLLMCAVALSTILTSQDAALAGLGIAYIFLSFEQMAVSVRKTSEVESYMTSVERVITYTKTENEPGYRVQRAPPEHWPIEGNITFQDVSMSYYPRGPQVLKRVDLQIKGGMNVGVAGRTGAGKSSLVAALQRMPEAQGVIMIDNVPIKEINLQKTRRCISVLDQSPVLFSGSLRKNLDLMKQFRDQDLWRALEDVQLKELVERLEGGLDHQLLEHGANFSVGERQLICLARVLLHQSKIIILDEPTAHVDPQTEQTIWEVVREKLKDSTVITIAHRLNTIKDCEMILVMNNGEINEIDSFELLVNTL